MFPPHSSQSLISWDFSKADFKQYPHFDAPLSVKEVTRIVTDPAAVAKVGFYPFLRYYDRWQPYRQANGKATPKPSPKERPISYAARRDAYIYMYYRYLLAERYEARLGSLGISEVPIAYRKIPKTAGGVAGKCNIDFASDAFSEVSKYDDCVAIALDIKSYFDCLDHAQIKKVWCELLGVDNLPADHEAVFHAITRYSYVDRLEAYTRLGHFGPKTVNGRTVNGYITPFEDMPKQLCSTKEFREKICGDGGAYKSLVKVNRKPYGIPQGSPISDIIANMYLLHFDEVMFEYARSRGGRYWRYSDDILLILPWSVTIADEAERKAEQEITQLGPKLKIKRAKTCIVRFRNFGFGLGFSHVRGEQGRNGLEYLGFRYDGTRVYVRDNTISRYYRKIATALGVEARRLAAKSPGMKAADLVDEFNFSLFLERWARKEDFKAVRSDHHEWTFWTYLERAASVFQNDRTFFDQIRGTKSFIHERLLARLKLILREP